MKWLAVIMFGFLNWSVASAEELKAGIMAPGFELNNQHGEKVSLAAQQGKWVVLYFYPKNNTPGCTTEACSFRDNINALIAKDAVVLGVSVDNEESHKSFAKEYRLPFSLLADNDAAVASLYNAVLDLKVIKFAKRHSFIIDPDGVIRKVYRSVSPENHVREVMADLKQLQSL